MNQESPLKAALTSDADLIARAQKGEEKAFEALFHTYKRRVFRLCLRMVGNVPDAEELTQEAFLTLFRKIQTFRGESAFSTWLLRVAMNVVLMRRRKKKLQEVPIDTDNENDDPEWTPTEYGVHDAVLEGLLDRVCLESAVAELPPGYRQVFELHDVLGCQHHEIAEILGYSVGNSKSQLHKARLRLRKLLGPSLRPRRRMATAVKATELEEEPVLA